MPAPPDADELRKRLRAALREALRTRNAVALAALRSAVSAIDNAEAVGLPRDPRARGERVTAKLGVGVGDVARRDLSAEEIAGAVRAEVEERISAAADYERLGREAEASRLRAEAAVLAGLLSEG